MSGSPQIYELRQNKFISRRLFVDLIRHMAYFHPLENYAYVGMGGVSLEDHKLIHFELGVRHLLSLESSPVVHSRQLFNNHIPGLNCLQKTTGDFLRDFENLVSVESQIPPLVVWFDYVDADKTAEQIGEFGELVGNLQHGDMARITLNAHHKNLFPMAPNADLITKQNYGFDKLRERLGDLMDSNCGPENITEEGYPQILVEAVRMVTIESLPAYRKRKFIPVQIERYADGQQMLCVTGVILSAGEESDFIVRCGMNSSPLYSQNWNNTIEITTPPLTTRERLEFDTMDPGLTVEEFAEQVGFRLTGDDEKSYRQYAAYKRFYRFYPHFHHVTY